MHPPTPSVPWTAADTLAIPPIALEATVAPDTDPHAPASLYTPCVQLTSVVNPPFDAALRRLGLTPRGHRSYAVTLTDAPPGFLRSLLALLPPGAVYHEAYASPDFPHVSRWGNANLLSTSLAQSPAGAFSNLRQLAATLAVPHPTEPPLSGAAILLGFTPRNQLRVKVCTAAAPLYPGAPDLNRLLPDRILDPIIVEPYLADTLLSAAARQGYPVVNRSPGVLQALRDRTYGAVVGMRLPGAPGLSRLAVGDGVGHLPAFDRPTPPVPETASQVVLPAPRTRDLVQQAARADCLEAVLDPAVADVVAMAAAAPAHRPGLRPYQDLAASIHVATAFGYVNACAPGLGKTVITLAALREKAAATEFYRALVVCPATIVSQWRREARRFFPEAVVLTPPCALLKRALPAGLGEAGPTPALAICSYESLRRQVDTLQALSWDDLVLDEAAILGSPGSGRTRAAWQVRAAAKVAVALTGTPVEKSLDCLGRLIAWARGDAGMFDRSRFERRFDVLNDPEALHGLWDAIGPVVFRRDRSEIADELPAVSTETVLIDPHPDEAALSRAATQNLRQRLDALRRHLDEVKDIATGDEIAQTRAEVAQLSGNFLGSVTLARMAASDPVAVAASGSVAAALLDTDGLVRAAVRAGGTKRRYVGRLVADLVARGEAVLLFSEFATVCAHLAEDLRRHGVRCGLFSGAQPQTARDRAVMDFQEGRLDALVMTDAGREGLNLQRASVLVHFDLPWLPTSVVQRVGRAARIGATGNQLSVLIPVMVGTIEERVVEVLLPRAALATAVLDGHRGVKGSRTEMGIALGSLGAAFQTATPPRHHGRLMEIAARILSEV